MKRALRRLLIASAIVAAVVLVTAVGLLVLLEPGPIHLAGGPR